MARAANFGTGKKRPAFFTPGQVGYAIGDVHGRFDLLTLMLERIEQDGRGEGLRPAVIFLGDYIDRGPSSSEVIELILTGRPQGFERRFLLGNHEQAALAFIDDAANNGDWLRFGGQETLASYGVDPPLWGASAEKLVDAADRLHRAMPREHLVFLRTLEPYVHYGDYAFVHAGVDPSRPLEDQKLADLLWVRDAFFRNKRAFSHFVVHGHTPQEAPFCDERRICVDTGAYASNRLTAVRLERDQSSFIEVRGA